MRDAEPRTEPSLTVADGWVTCTCGEQVDVRAWRADGQGVEFDEVHCNACDRDLNMDNWHESEGSEI